MKKLLGRRRAVALACGLILTMISMFGYANDSVQFSRVQRASVLTLDSCLQMAKQRNCTIRTTELDVAIAEEVKKQVLWKYFPQVSVEGLAFMSAAPLIRFDVTNIGKNAEAKEFLSDMFQLMDTLSHGGVSSNIELINWGVTANVKAVQPIYWGGMIVNGNRLAKLGIEAAKLQNEVGERDLLQQVEDSYWLVAGLQEKRETVRQAVELLDTLTDIVNTALEVGIATRNDLLKVTLKRNEIQTKSLQLENGIHLASRALCQLVGMDYTEELTLQPVPIEPELTLNLTLEDIDASARPENDLLEMNIRAEELRKKITIGETLPHIGIGAIGGVSNYFNQFNWNVVGMLSVSIPLTGWGETAHKIKEHNLRIEKARQMQQDLSSKMSLQNEQAYDLLTESIQLMLQHESAEEMAKDNYELSLMNYEAGRTTMSELLESQTLLLQAQNAYTDACINYRSALRKFKALNR